MTHWILKNKKKHRVLTKDSKDLQDYKEYTPGNFYSTFSIRRTHNEFYCKRHMKDRLKQYCNQESLVDVVLSGTDIQIISCTSPGIDCHVKDCLAEPQYKLVRHLL